MVSARSTVDMSLFAILLPVFVIGLLLGAQKKRMCGAVWRYWGRLNMCTFAASHHEKCSKEEGFEGSYVQGSVCGAESVACKIGIN